jgi:hypothetical protein
MRSKHLLDVLSMSLSTDPQITIVRIQDEVHAAGGTERAT